MFRPGLIFAALAAAFWWVILNYLPAALQIELLTALLLPLGGMALWRWGPGALRNLFSPHVTPAKILTIAVATMAFAVAFQSIWRLIYRWFGRPQDMADSGWVGFPVYGLVITLILYLLSTRRDTDPPMPLLMWIVLIGATVVLLVGFFVRAFYVGT